MAGTYWIGFKADTDPEEAKAAALAEVRKTDQAAVTAGPDVIPAPEADEENPKPQLQVRIVTGVQDPRVVAEAAAEAQAAQLAAGEEMRARLAALTPEHFAVLDHLVKAVRDAGSGGP